MFWDAIVVGAGPAGCTAATLLAREGLRVVLLEKSAAPPSKVCGEYLSPGCLRILDRIGAVQLVREAGARPLSGMVIHTAAGRSLRATYPSGKALGALRPSTPWPSAGTGWTPSSWTSLSRPGPSSRRVSR